MLTCANTARRLAWWLLLLLVLTNAATTLQLSDDDPYVKLTKWFVHRGGYLSPAVEPGYLDEYHGGGGLVVVQNEIQHLDLLMSIPETVMIHANETVHIFEEYIDNASTNGGAPHILHDTFADILDQAESVVDKETIVLTTRLLLEQCLANYSFYQPYLDALPKQLPPSLLTFSPDEWKVLLLDNIPTYQQTYQENFQQQQGHLKRMWQQVGDLGFMQLLVNGWNKINNNSQQATSVECDDDRYFSWDMFQLYYIITLSRVMRIQGVHVVMPMADLINFGPTPKDDDDDDANEEPMSSVFALYHFLDFSRNQDYSQGDDNVTIQQDEFSMAYKVHADRHFYANDAIVEDYGGGGLDARQFAESGGFVPKEFMKPDSDYVQGHHVVQIPTQFLFPTATSKEKHNATENVLLSSQLCYLCPVLPDDFLPDTVGVTSDGRVTDQKQAGRIAMIAMWDEDDGPGNACRQVWQRTSHQHRPNNDSATTSPITTSSIDHELVRAICTRYTLRQQRVKTVLQQAATRVLQASATSAKEDQDLLTLLSSSSAKGQISGLPSFVDPNRARVAIQLRLLDKYTLENLQNLVPSENADNKSCKSSSIGTTPETCEDAEIATVDGSPGRVTAEDVEAFNEFIESFSPPVSKIKVAFIGTDGMRVGVITTQDIAQGEPYFSFPLAGVGDRMNISFPDNPTLTAVVQEMQQDDKCDLCLEIFFLYEYYVRGNQSRWWPYLNLVPSPGEVKTMYPFYLDEDEDDLEALAGSDTRNYILQYKRSARASFDSLSNNYALVKTLGPSIALDWEKFAWAFNLHNTRGISWNGESHVLPMIDSINCNVLLDDHGVIMRPHTTGLNTKGTATVTLASKSYAANEQLYENYGVSNHHYVLHHGFFLEKNPYDCVFVNSVVIKWDGSVDIEPWLELMSQEIGVDSLTPTFCLGDVAGHTTSKFARFLRIKKAIESAVRFDDFDGSINWQEGFVLLREWIRLRLLRFEKIAQSRRWREVVSSSSSSSKKDPERSHLHRSLSRLIQREIEMLNDFKRQIERRDESEQSVD